ncbi:site-specific DNA-methyltransferase [Lonepinella koalarum]|uniref:site-specific DNA-methyltransferase n=1 Tax=Lonepinella koalarum TaxID=53417 RepID=UPI003F6DAC34
MNSTAQHSTAQHSTAQHSTAQHSTAQLTNLISKLKEIFQINQPDLDFGIYRILNSRSKEIADYLDRTLPAQIKTALRSDVTQETAVYNHLYEFFSRYYDSGDFVSLRRYKGNTYAIPYAGEEVMLHWANKDQYYTKSGENFSNYAFYLADDKRVQFRLVEADTNKDNRKDNEQKRLFVLSEQPIEETAENLVIPFEYKALGKNDKQADYIDQAVEQLKSHPFANAVWQELFRLAPTEKDAKRTLLKKYLQDYTTKNTADYFIHKNLGAFLTGELDFYIKNEVMNLDDIQTETAFAEIEQNLQLIKIFKQVAQEIIAFLAQLEDFQKKLWLKKKFVTAVHYLVTLDKLPDTLAELALKNEQQIKQWQTLFNVDASSENLQNLRQKAPHLVVDTSLFAADFQAAVLKQIDDLDHQTDGVLIHSDNFQALNLLQARYKEQVKCIYIDPPYNTEDDRATGKFIYKDNYAYSTWLSLMESRIALSKELLDIKGNVFISIDDNELFRLQNLCSSIFGPDNFISCYKWNKTSTPPSLSYKVRKKYEYVLCYEKLKNSIKYNGGIVEGGDMPLLNSGNTIVKIEFPKESVKFNFNGHISKGSYDRVYLHNDITVVNNYSNDNIILEAPFKWTQETVLEEISNGTSFIIKTERMAIRYERLGERIKRPSDIISKTECEVGTNEDANKEVKDLFTKLDVDYPKPTTLIKYLVTFSDEFKNSIVLDYFAGSGTTAHAVINLNREDGGKRHYILVEQGEYFDTVLKPRVQKVVFAENYKDGKPQADNSGSFNGVSQLVKVLKLESYEDTLNNLELKKVATDLFSQKVQQDYLLHYMLDVESRDSLLNSDHFAKPFDYQLNITTTSAGAYAPQGIDLVETFNYLIGLKVAQIDDNRERGIVAVTGTMPNGEQAFILWRDCEKVGYAELNRYLESRSINPADSEYQVVYINGDHNVPTVFADNDDTVQTLKVRQIETEFLARMFEM